MKKRDLQRIKAFYEQERQALFNYSLSRTGNRAAAEDLIQQIFLKLMQNGGAPRELKPYVFRALRNGAIDLARTRERRPEVLFDQETIAAEAAHAGLDDALVQALNTLDEHEREIIVLKVLDGLTFKEISDVLDAPMGTVSSWHRRGLEKMKAALAKEAP